MNLEQYKNWEKLDSPGFTLSNSLWALIPLEAWRRGLEIQLMPGARYVISDPNRSFSFRQTRLAGGEWDMRARKSDDKQVAREFFLDAGLPTPIGAVFDADASDSDFIAYANSIGFPVCVKPNDLAKGMGVFPKVDNTPEILEAVTAIRGLGTKSQIIVENHVPGVDVRVSVVGDKVVGASLRTAAYVIGDGRSTIGQLVDEKNMQRKSNPHLSLNLIQKDSVAENYLQSQSLEWDAVLVEGQKASLSGPANISAGGDSVDITDILSKQAKTIAIDAVKAMGLFHGGVDLLLDDYESEDAFIFVNELNPSSGLGPHIYPGLGERRNVPSAIVDFYFPGTRRIQGSHYWTFALDDVSRLFRDNAANAVTVPTLEVPRKPAWRRFVIEHDASSITAVKVAALNILRKREVSGIFRRIDSNRSQIAFSGDSSRVNLVDRSLKNLAVREGSKLRLASKSAFVAATGVRSI
ncbi:hypothetical protein ACTXN6_13840 [Corynebacterium casei]|uniref:hypothetical protein n=1 Tax=Corynebacterium casei TaxID=160386 RepID=UPI003FD011C2